MNKLSKTKIAVIFSAIFFTVDSSMCAALQNKILLNKENAIYYKDFIVDEKNAILAVVENSYMPGSNYVSDGAIIRSENLGRSWLQVNISNFSRADHLEKIEERAYVFNHFGEHFSSSDFGATWRRDEQFRLRSLGVNNHRPKNGVVNGKDSENRLFNVTQFKSLEQHIGNVKYLDSDLWTIAINKKNIYVAANGGLYRSEKNVEKWERLKSSFDMPKYIKKFFVTDNESIYFVVDGDFKYKDVDHTFIRSEGDMNWKRADFGFTPDVSFEILGVRENLVYFRIGDNEASRKQGIVNKVFLVLSH